MSDTVLERPLVREYLRALDAACASSLPVAQAGELREMIRWVHLTWTSDVCMGSGEGIIDWIPLQVRVGMITRTEDITPVEAFALQGPGQGKCG